MFCCASSCIPCIPKGMQGMHGLAIAIKLLEQDLLSYLAMCTKVYDSTSILP
ncbi:hypothetical protein COCOBI_pt-0080 (chloroplast) [Coccomyxa sp. Obi]|nr:hypothetical protein COCOBI_pt-0080 [Coccomyxa sp. Obi]